MPSSSCLDDPDADQVRPGAHFSSILDASSSNLHALPQLGDAALCRFGEALSACHEQALPDVLELSHLVVQMSIKRGDLHVHPVGVLVGHTLYEPVVALVAV